MWGGTTIYDWAVSTGELFDSVCDKILVPTLHRGGCDLVCDRKIFLGQTTLMKMEHLLPKLLSGTPFWQHAWNGRHEITAALITQKLGDFEVEINQLPSPESVCERSHNVGLDPYPR